MPEFDLTLTRSAIAPFVAQGRSGLLPALLAAQSIYGYLPEPVAAEAARALNMPLADVHGVIEFYSMLYAGPVGRTIVRVCTDPACALRGADDVLATACRKAHVAAPGETSADSSFTIERSPCLGLCNVGVAVNITTHSFAHAAPDNLNDVFAGRSRPVDDHVGGDVRVVTALCRHGRAATLSEYESSGGMQALRNVIEKQLSSQQIIDELKRSGRRSISDMDQVGRRVESEQLAEVFCNQCG
jgi:NADH-quinone oxidoreductase subunit F